YPALPGGPGATSTPFGYDAAGNRTADGKTSYSYDAANRIASPGYSYDANGNLIRETAGGVTTDFVLDERGPLPTILGEVRSDGAELRYAYGPDGISAQQVISGTSQELSYPLLDAL